MRRTLLAVLLLTCTCAPLLAQKPVVEPDPLTRKVTLMARVGRCSSPTFSPDGRTIAFVSDMSGVPQVWTVSADGGWPKLVTAFDDPVASVQWSPKGDWLAVMVAPGGGMNTQVYLVSPDGMQTKRLTAGGKENNWMGRWTHDATAIMVSSNVRGETMDSYLLTPNGEMKLVARNPGVGTLSDVSRDGKYGLVERMRSRGNNDVFLVELATGKETNLTPHEGPGTFSGMFGRDGRTVYLASNKDRDLEAFAKVKLGPNGAAGPIEVIASRDDAELNGFEINEQGTLAALLWNAAGKSELAFVDLKTEKLVPGPQLPAELAGALDFTPDGKKMAMMVTGSAMPPNVWVMDMASKRMQQVTHSPHAGVDLTKLTRPKLVRYTGHDGVPLSGWLYLPQGTTGAVPMVLSFHGGPEGQEVPSFRSDYQALLEAGIGVLAPNVRGSSGFGKKFVNLDNGELRVNAVKDIEASVNYVVSNGIADPKRLGIMGGSYGGYMVMAGLAEYPEMFAAGANLFGVVNFETFFKHTEPWMAAISTIEYGDPQTQNEMLKKLSPIHRVDKVKAATIVLHGANDTNVPVVEAEQVVDSLKQRGIPVNYVLFPDEGHGWRKVTNRIKSTVEIVNWFKKYLGEPVQTAGK